MWRPAEVFSLQIGFPKKITVETKYQVLEFVVFMALVTPEEKVAILRRHLVDKVPVSELCEELGLRPTVFYRWQKELFENGAAAFQSQERPHRQVEEKQKRIEFLEKKVQTKDEVLAELMAEHIALKKSLGEL